MDEAPAPSEPRTSPMRAQPKASTHLGEVDAPAGRGGWGHPHYQYDPNERLLATIHPDGSTTSTTYTPTGKRGTSTDELGRTTMLENGADVRFIQAMLGHARLSSTDIYTHVAIRKLIEIHSRTHPAAMLKRRAKLVTTKPEEG